MFDHNPNVTIAPTPDRARPLHVLFHRGVAGTNHPMEVTGTHAAAALCAARYVNR